MSAPSIPPPADAPSPEPSEPWVRRVAPIDPVERLGRWDGRGWVPVAAGSVLAPRVYVLVHGWTPGLRAAMSTYGYLNLWDEPAQAQHLGRRRYDMFYNETAAALASRDPAAAVLGYTWADESATRTDWRDAALSQRRTITSGRRLALGLQQALEVPWTPMQLMGHSHGSKVAVVAASYLDHPPRQITILDSPDRPLISLGRAQNDLGDCLRLLTLHPAGTQTVLENVVSQTGVPFGGSLGTHEVHDILLRPSVYAPEHVSAHSYAWYWYAETIANPALDVGFAWSAMLTDPVDRPSHTMRQDPRAGDPHALVESGTPEPAPEGQVRLRPPVQVDTEGVVLATPDRTVRHQWTRRRRDGALLRIPFRWLRGSPGDRVEIRYAGQRIWSSRYGWPGNHTGQAIIPVVSLPVGPHRLTATLTAADDAAVLFGPDLERITLSLPAGRELRGVAGRLAVSAGVAGAAFVLAPRLVPGRHR